MDEYRDTIINKPISTALWSLALPMMLESVVLTILNLTDMFWVGRLGKEALAAAGIVGMLMITISSIAFGLSIGVIAIVSRRIGERNGKGAAEGWLNGTIIGLVIGILVTLIMIVLQNPILDLFGMSPETLELGKQYYIWIFAARPLLFISSINGGALRGAGRPKLTLIANIIAVVLNMFLDPVLIFGWLGFPELGIAGAAIATIFSEFVAASILTWFSYKTFSEMSEGLIRIKSHLMMNVLKIGLPSSLQTFVMFTARTFLMGIVSKFGDAVTAAYTVSIRAQEFITLPVVGMGNAVATLVGQNLGARKPERSEQAVYKALFYNTIIVVSLSILFVAFAKTIIGLFNNDPMVIDEGRIILSTTFIANILMPLSFIPQRGLSGAGDTITALMISAGTQWVLQIPLCFVLANMFGQYGVWWGINAGSIVMAIISISVFRTGRWKRHKI